jgi:hypothetical protein
VSRRQVSFIFGGTRLIGDIHSLQETQMLVTTKVGKSLLVWSEDGKKPGTTKHPVIICCHGGQSSSYKLMTVP